MCVCVEIHDNFFVLDRRSGVWNVAVYPVVDRLCYLFARPMPTHTVVGCVVQHQSWCVAGSEVLSPHLAVGSMTFTYIIKEIYCITQTVFLRWIGVGLFPVLLLLTAGN